MEETISLKELLGTLKRRFLLIVSLTLVAGIFSGVISFYYLTPVYQASTQLLVNRTSTDQTATPLNYGEIQTNMQLINTYSVIIKSPFILDKVVDELDLNMSTSQLNSKISVGSQKDTQVVNIVVQDTNPKNAAQIANATAKVFQSNIKPLMNIDNVKILSEAEEIPWAISPRPLMNIAIALVVGLMAGVGLSFLLEYFNNTVKNEDDIKNKLELPVLGVIAEIDDQQIDQNQMFRPTGNTSVGGETIGS